MNEIKKNNANEATSIKSNFIAVYVWLYEVCYHEYTRCTLILFVRRLDEWVLRGIQYIFNTLLLLLTFRVLVWTTFKLVPRITFTVSCPLTSHPLGDVCFRLHLMRVRRLVFEEKAAAVYCKPAGYRVRW